MKKMWKLMFRGAPRWLRQDLTKMSRYPGAFLVFILMMVVTASASAQTVRCTTDAFGTTRCRSSDGMTMRGTNQGGQLRYRYGDGTTVRGYTDGYTTRLRDDSGTVYRGRHDAYGSTWRSSTGRTMRCRTDAFGVTTCR